MLARVDSALAQRPLSSHGDSRHPGSCAWPGCTAGSCPRSFTALPCGRGVHVKSASASRAARICCAANPWTRSARQDVEGSAGGDAGEQVGVGVRFALGAQSDRFSCKAFHVGAQFLTQNIVCERAGRGRTSVCVGVIRCEDSRLLCDLISALSFHKSHRCNHRGSISLFNKERASVSPTLVRSLSLSVSLSFSRARARALSLSYTHSLSCSLFLSRTHIECDLSRREIAPFGPRC
jgi:hypothetical protein